MDLDDINIDVARGDIAQTAVAIGIVVGGFIAARVVSALLTRIIHRFTRSTKSELDDQLVGTVRGPLIAFVVVQAIFIGLRTLSYLDDHRDTLEEVWVAVILVFAVLLVARVAAVLLTWYGTEFSKRARSGIDEKTLPIVRRLVNVTIYAIGIVLVLDQLGVSVSPLLAGLGLSGLAVALAIQPLLSNVFAGSYVLSDASLGVGDFIEVENGPSGWVEDIGWRATRIRTFDNNIVMIPNSTLAESVITNFDIETPEVGVPVVCGVAYEADLNEVERIVREVLEAINADCDQADAAYEPVMLFTGFGDSNIDFLMKLRAFNRREVATVAHEMIKRVHSRLGEAGITINYPARRLFLEEADTSGLERLARPATG